MSYVTHSFNSPCSSTDLPQPPKVIVSWKPGGQWTGPGRVGPGPVGGQAVRRSAERPLGVD